MYNVRYYWFAVCQEIHTINWAKYTCIYDTAVYVVPGRKMYQLIPNSFPYQLVVDNDTMRMERNSKSLESSAFGAIL